MKNGKAPCVDKIPPEVSGEKRLKTSYSVYAMKYITEITMKHGMKIAFFLSLTG